MCNLWMSLVSYLFLVVDEICEKGRKDTFTRSHFNSCFFPSQRSLFTACNVAFAALEASMPSGTATNAACVFRSVFLTLTSVSRTNTRTIALSAEKICSLPGNLPKICLAVMRFMLIASANSPALITDAPFAKRRWCPSNPWLLPGKHAPEISQSIPCLETFNEWSTLCVTTAKPRVTDATGISWVSNAPAVIRLTPSSNRY
jgi:hypothetical protein